MPTFRVRRAAAVEVPCDAVPKPFAPGGWLLSNTAGPIAGAKSLGQELVSSVLAVWRADRIRVISVISHTAIAHVE